MYPSRIIIFDSNSPGTFLFVRNGFNVDPIICKMKADPKFSYLENKKYHFFFDKDELIFCYWKKQHVALHRYKVHKASNLDPEVISPHASTNINYTTVNIYEGKTKKQFLESKNDYSLPGLLITEDGKPLIYVHEKNNNVVLQEIPVDRTGSYKGKRYFPVWSYPILFVGTPIAFVVDTAFGIVMAPVFVTVNLAEMFAR